MGDQASVRRSQGAEPAGMSATCPCCGSAEIAHVYEIRNVPTNSCILLKTREEATGYPRGDIRLGSCRKCGFLSNFAFDRKLTEYSGRYEETQAFSPTFNAFHEALVRKLVDKHDLKGKDIIEIGCGKGEFLRLLCEAGENRGLGFDPGYSESRGVAMGASRFRVVRDFFSEAYTNESADFVCSKMTLEHIPQPYSFLEAAARVTRRPNGVLFIQVPEAKRIVRDCAFEDIYYEHCSYFTAGSLARLLARLGLVVVSVDVEYDEQYLTVEAKYAGQPESVRERIDDLAELSGYLATFKQRVEAKIEEWRQRLEHWASQGKSVVIWGSGSKGVAFLHAVPSDPAHVARAVDINPYRQGYFMPGTGHEIVSPEALTQLCPDAVVVMNRIYVPEIREMLRGMALAPELAAL